VLHPFAGASRSRRRARFIPASASAGRASRTSSQSGRRVRQQRPVCNHQRLSALSDLRKTIPRKAAAPLNPDRRPTAHRFPAGSFFGGFRTPALYPVDRSPGPASETLHETLHDTLHDSRPSRPHPGTGRFDPLQTFASVLLQVLKPPYQPSGGGFCCPVTAARRHASRAAARPNSPSAATLRQPARCSRPAPRPRSRRTRRVSPNSRSLKDASFAVVPASLPPSIIENTPSRSCCPATRRIFRPEPRAMPDAAD